MALPDTLSQFSPHPGPDILLEITIHHACLSPERKEAFQQAFVSNPEMCGLNNMIITGWPDNIKAVPCPLHPYWQHWETLAMLKMALSYMEKLSSVPSSERERVLQQLHQFHQGTTKAQLFAHGCFLWLGINKAIEEAVWQCETCTRFQAQNAAAPLTPIPTPSHPWQTCAPQTSLPWKEPTTWYAVTSIQRWSSSDIFHLAKATLSKSSHCSKRCSQEHGILEVLCSDNGPQYVSEQFIELCTSWGITHETSSPHYQQSNGFAEACVKSVKHALQHAKYSSADPQLAPFWCSELHPLMPSSHHLLSYCTNARLGPPFLPEFATLIWQPSRFMGTNWCLFWCLQVTGRQTMQISLHPCMLASLLWCTTPSIRSGFLSLWYASCQKTATKCTPVIAWSTSATWDDTFCEHSVKPTDTTSDCHISHTAGSCQTCAFLQHCLHLPSLHNCCSPHLLHLQCMWLPDHRNWLSPKSCPVPAPVSATPSIAHVQPHRSGNACTIAPKHLIQEV